MVGLILWSISELQLWLFGVKYMESAIKFSSKPLFINKKQLNMLFWGIVAMFVAATLVLLIMEMVNFPGYSDPSWIQWITHGFRNIDRVYCVFWFILSLSAICITMYAVYIIRRSFQLIQLKEASLTLKTKPLIAHCMLLFVTLGLQCVYMIEVYSKPSENVELIMMAIIPFSNLSVQLLVVFLIWTQGTDK
jgi:hypothetical protein